MAETPSIDEAINAVLRAERDAKNTVEECRKEADRQLAEAREKARRIARRTDARITALHGRCSTATHREIETMLESEHEPETGLPRESEKEILRAAIKALATELTGGNEE